MKHPSPCLVLAALGVLSACQRGGPATGVEGEWVLAVNNHREASGYEIYRADPETGETTNISTNAATDWAYAGFGERLAVVSNREPGLKEGQYWFYEMNPRSGQLTRIADMPVYDSFVGRGPGGALYALSVRDSDNIHIVIVGPEGEIQRRVTDGDSRNSDPDWSPDGETLIFRSDRSGVTELWSMELESGETRQLTNDPENDDASGYGGEGPPRFSPDGSKIVWSCRKGGDPDICVMDADGSDRRNLTPDAEGEDFYPSWSPDGTRIVFTSDRGGKYDIYEIPAEGGEAKQLVELEGDNISAVWVRMPEDAES